MPFWKSTSTLESGPEEGVGELLSYKTSSSCYVYNFLFRDAFLDLEASTSLGFTDLLTLSLVDAIHHLILLYV